MKQKKQSENILDNMKLKSAIRLAAKKINEKEIAVSQTIYQNILEKFPKNKEANEGLRKISFLQSSSGNMTREPSSDEMKILISLFNQRKFEELLTVVGDMQRQNPRSPNLLNIEGVALTGIKKFQRAIECYKLAISLKPDFAEAYFNLGRTQYASRMLDAAVESLKKSLSIHNKYPEAYNFLGKALFEKGKFVDAVKQYNNALKFNPNYQDAFKNMAFALKFARFKEPVPGVEEKIIQLLKKKTLVRPSEIAGAIISLLKFDKNFAYAYKYFQKPDKGTTLVQLLTRLSKVSLLIDLMKVTPVPSLIIERILVKVRSLMLHRISELKGQQGVLPFSSALALQCFTNEFVFLEDASDRQALMSLLKSIQATINSGLQCEAIEIICLASYRNLNDFSFCNLLKFPPILLDLKLRHIDENIKEKQIQKKIPILGEISNNVSSIVRDQYEQSPYPRWVNLGLSNPRSINEILKSKQINLRNRDICNLEKLKILIAGCGTGQHPIHSASLYKNSEVLAIDLSLRSLSYAERKTKELGVKNIEYMQADILDLKKLNRKFDIIESVGVLHHMKDPVAGWRTLVESLNIGGLIKIGLYSSVARKLISKIREENKGSFDPGSIDKMRLLREKLIENLLKDLNKSKSSILNVIDFFSMSDFRDLVFHVQEHQFTLPECQKIITQLNLFFCGFEHTSHITKEKFRETFKEIESQNDLQKWHEFELKNPDTFAAMYQFWCQKL